MLETERLILRPFLPEDADTLYQLVYADLEVKAPWSSYQGTQEEFRERFQTDPLYNASDGTGLHYYALVRKEDNALLGLMGFQDHGKDEMDWLLMPDGSRNVGHIRGCLDVELTYAMGKEHWG